jgi:hypothetical protein
MTRSPRDDFRPWARDLPTVVLRILLAAMLPGFLLMAAWDGGVKEGWLEFVVEWRAAGAPRSKKP